MGGIVVRPLEWREIPPAIPYRPGVTGWGGGCEHLHRPGVPCGCAAGYLVGDKKLCWSHGLAGDSGSHVSENAYRSERANELAASTVQPSGCAADAVVARAREEELYAFVA
jgi:hypothetical protein